MEPRDFSFQSQTSNRTSRRTALRRGAMAVALTGSGLAVRSASAQEATPDAPLTTIPGFAGPILSAVFTDLPTAPAEVSISRAVTQPGEGDIEDFFAFAGPLAFIVESGVLTCRCGTAENPCILIGPTGAGEPAPPIPADILLGPGQGLYIPANTQDSYTNAGDEPVVEIDLLILPKAVDGTADASPTA